MKKIELAEILDLTAYEKARESIRAAVMALKVNRRTSLGDQLTVLSVAPLFAAAIKAIHHGDSVSALFR